MEVHALWAEDGALAWFENRGGRFEEEEGFLGADIVELFDVVSLGVSAGGSESTLGADSGERLGEMEGGRSIRIVSTNADNFAAICRDTTRGHCDRIRIQYFQCKFAEKLSLTELVVAYVSNRGKRVFAPRQILASITITTPQPHCFPL